jgi:hypothetical protein
MTCGGGTAVTEHKAAAAQQQHKATTEQPQPAAQHPPATMTGLSAGEIVGGILFAVILIQAWMNLTLIKALARKAEDAGTPRP